MFDMGLAPDLARRHQGESGFHAWLVALTEGNDSGSYTRERMGIGVLGFNPLRKASAG